MDDSLQGPFHLPRIFKRRRVTLLFIGFSGVLLILTFAKTHTFKENNYGFEHPTGGYDQEDENGDQENSTDFQQKMLSPAMVGAKLLALAEGINRLKLAPARAPVINALNNFSIIETLFLREKVKKKKICDKYYAEGRVNRTVLISPWQPYNNYEPDDVTMVAHMNIDKMDVLDLLLSFWPGPLSVAVDIRPSQFEKFSSTLNKYREWATRDNLDLHFVRNDGEYYPVNYLRQVAKQNIKTRYVFLNDIDFIPQSKLYQELRKLRSTVDTSKTVYVVAAFEFLTIPEFFPHTRKDLFREWELGNIQPFHYQPSSLFGHNATEYKKWISAKQPYQITWGVYYEPYIFAEADRLPDYDVRYLGRYMDKITFIDKIAAIGFDFVVLPKLFIIHYIHPVNLDDSYLSCAEDLYHDFHFPEMRRLWEKRGSLPPKRMYTRGAKPPEQKKGTS